MNYSTESSLKLEEQKESAYYQQDTFTIAVLPEIKEFDMRVTVKRMKRFMQRQEGINARMMERLEQFEEKMLFCNEKNYNQEDIFPLYDKLFNTITILHTIDDIRDQVQYTTIALQQIDQIFSHYSLEQDKYRKQLILKLRSALKLNSTKKLFTTEQIKLLENVILRLQGPTVKKQDVWDVLGNLEDSDLSPFPELEDNNETVPRHDNSD